jgi:hypothetical protein
MGFNLQSGHHSEVYDGEFGEKVASALRQQLGPDIPLGAPGNLFCHGDQMGWSWWSELQSLAGERLGEAKSRCIRAVDAWNGVYVDSQLERALVYPDGEEPPPPRPMRVKASGGGSFWTRLKRRLGMQPQLPAGVEEAMQQMRIAYGAREGEGHALQISSLRGVLAEADALLRAMDVDPSREPVEALLDSYIKSPDKFDDDPGIQCLCHLWLTATHSLEHRQPMWLIK